MSQNLITAEVIDPTQLPLDQVQLEVATLLKSSPNQIEHLKCWPDQIWVKLVEAHAKFISYRSLLYYLSAPTKLRKRLANAKANVRAGFLRFNAHPTK